MGPQDVEHVINHLGPPQTWDPEDVNKKQPQFMKPTVFGSFKYVGENVHKSFFPVITIK